MQSVTPMNMRKTLGRFATGVTVVSARTGEESHAITANSFTSVSLDPPLILVSIDNRSRMNDYLARAERFAVSILHASQERLAWHFAGKPLPEPGELFTPDTPDFLFVNGAIAHIGCELYARHEAGDHWLVLGRVVHLASHGGDPLLFHGGQFEMVAPTAHSQAWG